MTNTQHTSAMDRCPDKPWGRVWCVMVFVFVGVTGSLESMWRWGGHRPSVSDSARLWSWTRQQVSQDPAGTVVVVGDSRTQLGIDVATARQKLGRPVIQLSIAGGGPPLASLEELAADSSFRGLVIAGVVPGWFENPALLQEKYVTSHQRNMAVFDGFEASVEANLASILVVKRRMCNLRTSVGSILRGRLPAPEHRAMDIDRQIKTDFLQIDLPPLRQKLLSELLDKRSAKASGRASASWGEFLKRYANAARLIQSRGGKVVFVYMPISGPRVPLDEAANPRSQYWDVFAETVRPFAQTIHFEDSPELRSFECPDMSHLDAQDAGPFTDALLRHIK